MIERNKTDTGSIEAEDLDSECLSSSVYGTALFDICSDGLLATDHDGQILYHNEGVLSILGCTKEDFLTCTHISIFIPEWETIIRSRVRCLSVNETVFLKREPLSAHAVDGGVVPVDVSATLVCKGGKQQLLLLLKDRSAHEQIARKLEETYKQLLHAEKLASVGNITVGIAHEINNLLAGVVMYAALVLEQTKRSDPKYDDLLNIVEEATRCRDIVKDLLEYVHLSSQEMKPIDINVVIETGLKLLIKKAMFRNLHVIRELDADIPKIYGDPSRLRQVIVNIVINAVDAMQGNGTLTIRSSSDLNKHTVQVEISDTGPGISEDVLPQIFDPFFTTKEPGKGTGLGLSVIYSIIKNHHGTISVESRLGKGTSFLIDLPVLNEGMRHHEKSGKTGLGNTS